MRLSKCTGVGGVGGGGTVNVRSLTWPVKTAAEVFQKIDNRVRNPKFIIAALVATESRERPVFRVGVKHKLLLYRQFGRIYGDKNGVKDLSSDYVPPLLQNSRRNLNLPA